MTEEEWLTSTDPQAMLDYVEGRASTRKLGLFAYECCCHVRRLLSDPRSKAAIKVLGRFLDGRALEAELRRACNSATDVLENIRADATEQRWHYVHESAARAVSYACDLFEGN